MCFCNSSEHASVVSDFNPTSRAVEYRELFGLPMAYSSSPLQFCRISESLSTVTQLSVSFQSSPFLDDYMMLDRGDGNTTVNRRV